MKSHFNACRFQNKVSFNDLELNHIYDTKKRKWKDLEFKFNSLYILDSSIFFFSFLIQGTFFFQCACMSISSNGLKVKKCHLYKNGDDLKWDPEQYRSLVIICTKVKNLVKIWNTLTYWSGRSTCVEGFFLTFYKRVGKNIFRAGFLEVPITLT